MASEGSATRAAPPAGSPGRPGPLDAALLASTALLLAAGFSYARATTPGARHVTALGGALVLTVPRGWSGAAEPGRYRTSAPGLSDHGATLSVREIAVPGGGPGLPADFVDLELARIERVTARSGVGYRVIETEERAAFGQSRSHWTHYAIVRDPRGSAPGAAVLPAVLRGVDVLVTTGAGRAFHVQAEAPADVFGEQTGPLRRTIESVRIRP